MLDRAAFGTVTGMDKTVAAPRVGGIRARSLYANPPVPPPPPAKAVVESANPAWTCSVHRDAPGQRHGQQPVSGTADPGVVKQDKSSTFGPTEGRNVQW